MKKDSIELYASPNGDRWLLRIGADEQPVVRHVPNLASGGAASDIAVARFLALEPATPQRDAMLQLIKQLVPNCPDSCRRSSVERGTLRPAAEALLLTAARIRTFAQDLHLTNASGFFFGRDGRLFLVTSRHVVRDEPSKHLPDRLEIELHIDRENLGASMWFSVPLFADGTALWRQGSDDGGEIDVAVLELQSDRLPRTAIFDAFGPEHLPKADGVTPIGASVLIVGFPLGFHDSLHHLPVVRQGVIASAFGLRFQGRGCFITDARTHRGTSGAPVVMSKLFNDVAGESLDLPWVLLGIHSSTIDMGARNVQIDETLGLNSAWYSDVLLTLTS
ncbi:MULTISPECIES: serine protease [Caballeronia]|uniref:S1 family peptidase n=1 Tax=Caballeronia TaxID=1827195 RepID=UPI0027E01567|nr:serine protease [Caballeronia zhejiangensis]